MSTSPEFRQRGMTLIELILAIVIIGVCVAGVMGVYTQAVRNSADPMLVKQSYAIAEALLEEVQLASFSLCDPSDPGAETGACTPGFVPPAATRPFDHVLKYNGLAFTAAPNPGNRISGMDLAAINGLGAYAATVTVTPAALNNITAASGNAVLIRVSVTAPDTSVHVLEGWRTRYAPNEP